ncbi:hypothetical protein [Sulfobacillus thermosulfidooxidans]|uniref:hypothetical protein n=1 Tax=Sulfobacillus thermosulfidooxidans TaxID=28034 RepID=UPI00096BCBC0|nr:hypothetical protein [Sulfobacillus thermosulfidooxidans]OLZ09595.1 hypothetical protein BFX05_11575 [Sulfobacillus thermosulfidooxidans]OLZ16099.1 hypothetical protein BFX06_03465 [Sulfobacillus thermosulfidooxidans]OLZ18053.1 hypothetical protein BFX07_06665 [Sulfobacillus thermosulfidooxidans]
MVGIMIITGLGLFFMVIWLHYRLKQLEWQQHQLLGMFGMDPELGDFDFDIRMLLAQNRRVEAIRLLRERRQCSLLEAKEMIDTMVPLDKTTSLADFRKRI